MNQQGIGLIIFAFTALGAVLAFIFVFGGPEEDAAWSGASVHSLKERDAYEACSTGTYCDDNLPGIPTGEYDPANRHFQCTCQTSDPPFTFWRARYIAG